MTWIFPAVYWFMAMMCGVERINLSNYSAGPQEVPARQYKVIQLRGGTTCRSGFVCTDAGTSRSARMRVSDAAAIRWSKKMIALTKVLSGKLLTPDSGLYQADTLFAALLRRSSISFSASSQSSISLPDWNPRFSA